MELTPQSSRSPASPFRYTQTPQPLYEYPSPAHSDSRYRSTDSLPGLGLYSCPMPAAAVEENEVLHAQGPPSAGWPTAALNHHPNNTRNHIPHRPQQASGEYDAFTPYPPPVTGAYVHDIYATHQQSTEQLAALPSSPVPSGNSSQRSSFSSTPASEVFTQAGSVHGYTPPVKMEDAHAEYVTNGIIMSSPQMAHNLLGPASNPYPGSLEATFYPDPNGLGWSKEYPASQELPSISALPLPGYPRRSGSEQAAPVPRPHDPRRVATTLNRTRQPRRLTTKEDANFQCTVKGCGKLFGRSYNYKAHMETHDSSREYPFPCPLNDCTKKFVRKTDLQRHHQSVHMKQRNHRCDFCSRFFARKDTLRRHMEDGCSKRFDIETVDFRPQQPGYTNSEPRPSPTQSRLPAYHAPPAGFAMPAGPAPGPGAHEYPQHPVWSS